VTWTVTGWVLVVWTVTGWVLVVWTVTGWVLVTWTVTGSVPVTEMRCGTQRWWRWGTPRRAHTHGASVRDICGEAL
jgi:hypothetical protein